MSVYTPTGGGGLPGVTVSGTPANAAQGLVSTSTTTATWQNVMPVGPVAITSVLGSAFSTRGSSPITSGTAGQITWVNVMWQAANTPVGGTLLINGTGNIFSATTPNDGDLHTVLIALTLIITVAQTGGQVQVTYVTGGVTLTTTAYAGSTGINNLPFQLTALCDPNTTINVNQSTAQTAGTARLYGQISIC